MAPAIFIVVSSAWAPLLEIIHFIFTYLKYKFDFEFKIEYKNPKSKVKAA